MNCCYIISTKNVHSNFRYLIIKISLRTPILLKKSGRRNLFCTESVINAMRNKYHLLLVKYIGWLISEILM